jgi:hypothetical protein
LKTLQANKTAYEKHFAWKNPPRNSPDAQARFQTATNRVAKDRGGARVPWWSEFRGAARVLEIGTERALYRFLIGRDTLDTFGISYTPL